MRCLLLADVHGNLSALEAVLRDAGAVDAVWCLGDVVGLGTEPEGCAERLRLFLGETAFGAARACGRWLPLGEAVALGLGETH